MAKGALQTCLKILLCGDCLPLSWQAQCDPRGPCKRQAGEAEPDRTLKLHCWLWRCREGLGAPECRQLAGAEKGKKMGSPPRAPKRMQSCGHLDFSLWATILNFWTSELWKDPFVMFQVTTFMVISYNSKRKLTQHVSEITLRAFAKAPCRVPISPASCRMYTGGVCLQ